MTTSNPLPSTWHMASFQDLAFFDENVSGLRHNQGLAWNADAGEWISSWNFGLSRATSDHTFLQTTGSFDFATRINTTGIPKELADRGYDHIGDIDYYNGIIYASLDSKEHGYQDGQVALFNASDLSYIGVVHAIVGAPSNPHNDVASWVAVDGANGLGYGKEWQSGTTINVYNLDNWSFKGTLEMDMPLDRIQGAKLFNGKLYMSANDEYNSVYSLDLSTGHVEKLFDLPPTDNASYETQGIALRQLADGSVEMIVEMTVNPVGDSNLDSYARLFRYVNGQPTGEAPNLAHTFIISTTSDIVNPDDFSVSLREAIMKANPGDTITFDASMKGKTITLDGAALELSKNVTIKGDIDGDGKSDITINAGKLGTAIHVSAGNAVLDGLTVLGTGQAIVVDSGATLSFTHGSTAKPGTPGDDILTGSDNVGDTISGGAGNDIINGLGGDDILSGGAGEDVILGGQGNDLIDGGDGDDTLIGNEGDDTIIGGEGNDLIDGGEGNDTLIGGNGSDTYVYTRGSGSDVIIEGAGNAGDQDRLFLDDLTRNQVVIHRQGADVVISIGTETVTLKNQLAGGGIEVLSFADGTALVGAQIAAAAVNRGPVVAAPAVATGAEDTKILGQVVASDADGDHLNYAVKTGFGPQHGVVLLDAATGKWSYDPAANYNGADRFTVIVSDGFGGSVEQVITLDVTPVNDAPVAVDDVGVVGEGESRVFDLVANDTDVDGNGLTLSGFSVETVDGIALSKEVVASAFSIVDGKLSFAPGSLFAGLHDGQSATLVLSYGVSDGSLSDTGHFTLTVNGEGKLQTVIVGTEGSNILIGTDGDDAISAYGGNDYVFGRDGADVIDGGDGNDYLFGGNGNDVINGGKGNDTLFGDAGDDVLIGDAGNDRLIGGAGNDTFVFRSGFGHDTVMDFSDGDIIDLSTADFANFADIAQHLTDTDLGATLTLHDGSTLTLSGHTVATLNAGDFHLA